MKTGVRHLAIHDPPSSVQDEIGVPRSACDRRSAENSEAEGQYGEKRQKNAPCPAITGL